MSTFAVLPMKSTLDAKSRLEDGESTSLRAALAEAMFTDVLTGLGRCRGIAAVIVVTGDERIARTAQAHGATVHDDSDAENHSEAALIGAVAAANAGARGVLMVPGDCPLLDPAEIDALLEAQTARPSVVVVPDRHGEGTNALLISPPDAFSPSFGPGSRQRHLSLAEAAGVSASIGELPSLGLDVDTPEDLKELRARLGELRGGAAHTRGLLAQVDRSGVHA